MSSDARVALGRQLGPPPWTRFPRAWAKAIDLYQGPPPTLERPFIHRDYHPGNVLWRRQHVTGIVDWQSASIGSPMADVAHCRSNLVDHFGIAAADQFLTLWQTLSGRRDYHRTGMSPWSSRPPAPTATRCPPRRVDRQCRFRPRLSLHRGHAGERRLGSPRP